MTAKEILTALEKKGTRRNVEGMARYGIVAKKVFGISVADIRAMGKKIGKDHELAEQRWESGWYEARLLAAFVEDPKLLTGPQMNRWAKDFDNWAICDHSCFHLFDRSPLAWKKIREWSTRKDEFVKRASFALLASVALHDKRGPDQPFIDALPLIEKAASDDRNFVKKGVSWALRGIGHRSPKCRAAAMSLGRRLAASDDKAERWVGKDTIRDLSRPVRTRKA